MKGSRPRRWLTGASLAIALGGVLACGSLPIPRHAIEGTTIMIAIPGSFRPGFGHRRSDEMDRGTLSYTYPGVAYTPGHPSEDEIRGELSLMLGKRSTGQLITVLPVRYVTRVHLDEASVAGEDDPLGGGGGVGEYAGGQVLVFVDIPEGVVAANGGDSDFVIWMWRVARTPGQPNVWESLPNTIGGTNWNSWGGATQTGGIPIDIFEGNGQHYNDDYKGWEDILGYTFQAIGDDLEDLVPRPKALMRVYHPTSASYPAAWTAEIQYPLAKGQVIGVEAATNQKSTAMVTMTSEPPDPGSCPGPTEMGSVRISMVDPRQRTEGVRLIIKPPDFNCATSGRLVQSNFVISSVVAYDVDGNPIPDGEIDRYFTTGIR